MIDSRHMLKSKIHRAVVTDACVDYEGSISLDLDLMDAADVLPNERVQVLSIDTGARLETYAIPGKRGSGVVCINGAAARVIGKGEKVIVLSYTWLDDDAARRHEPKIVLVDERNKPV